jgi:hypothetical protein
MMKRVVVENITLNELMTNGNTFIKKWNDSCVDETKGK